VLHTAFQETLRHCVPGSTCREVFRLAADNIARSEAMALPLRGNQAYEEFLTSLDTLQSRVTAWTEEEAKNPASRQIIRDRVVALLQKSGTRNTIAAIQLNRLSRTGLKRKKNDRFILSPKEQIRYALAAEEECQNRGLPGAEQCYQAGYHYDVLNAVLNARKASNDAKNGLKSSWSEGLKTARVASAIAGALKSFHHHQYVFPASLLAPIGKPLMAIFFPADLGDTAWVKFLASCEKLGDKQYLALWTGQRRRYPISDAELGALVVSFVGLFPEIEPVIAFQRDPQLLRAGDRELYRLAGLISIASALTQLPARSGRAGHLNAIHLTALKDLGLEPDRLDLLVETALQKEEG
jgi:hypothetical protein